MRTESQDALRTRRTDIIGTYSGRVGEKLLVTREKGIVGAAPDTIPLFLVRELDVSQGMHSRTRLVATGFAVGSVVSLGAYAVIHMLPALCGPSQGDPCPAGQKRTRGLDDNRIYAIPVVLGTVLGALVPREKWSKVATPSVSFDPARMRDITVALRVVMPR